MTAPELAAQRFLYACLTGGLLGMIYGFLRPLRPKRTALSDLLFVPVALYGWLFVHFRLCGGDSRIAWSFAMVLGGFGWELTVGRMLRPVFSAFWESAGAFVSFLTRPAKKFCKNKKILFASAKKWVTMYCDNCRHNLSKFGGKYHGRFQKNLEPDPAGERNRRETDGHYGRDRHRIVYDRPVRSAHLHGGAEGAHR